MYYRDQKLERAFLLPLRAHRGHRETPAVLGYRKKSREKRERIARNTASAKPARKAVKLYIRRIFAPYACGAFDVLDDGMQRSVDVMRRALVAQRRIRRSGDGLAQGFDDA